MKTTILVAIALVGPVLLGLVTSLAETPLGRPYFRARDGMAEFQNHCARCHGEQPGERSAMGPNLAEIGRLAGSRRPGMSATEYLVESIVLPGAFRASGEGQMPGEIEKFLDDRQIRSLVAYLASLGGTPDYAAIASVDIAALRPKDDAKESQSLDLAQIERGRQLFLGEAQCVQCHSVRRSVSDRLTAPATDSLAMHGEQYLKESITNPSAVCAEPYRQHTVVTPDGAVYSGRIMRKDDSGLLLLTVDSAGRLKPMTFPLGSESAGEELIEVSTSSESPMPKSQLTEDQIDDLVAFLMSISELH